MNRNVLSGLVTIAIGVAVYIQGTKLPPPSMGDVAGAGAFPKLWGGLLVLLGAILAGRGAMAGKGEKIQKKSGEFLAEFRVQYGAATAVFCLLLVQVWLMQYIGFVLSSMLFIPACAYLFGARTARSLGVAALTGVLLVIGLYCFFVYGMQMPLPSNA